MTKQAVLTAVAVAVIGAGTFAASSAFAQSSTTVEKDTMSSLAQKIADKFGLNKADVEAVFEADRKERHKKMKTAYSAQLDQYVKDGKITEAQKQLILEKHNELEAKHQSLMQDMQNMTADERKSAMQKEKQALSEWAKENGIDLQYLMPFRVKVGGHGMKGEKPFATMHQIQ